MKSTLYRIIALALIFLGTNTLVLKAQEDLNFQLLEASADSSLEKVTALIALGADVNSRSEYGFTPLMYACDLGHIEMAMLLIDSGAYINDSSYYSLMTPLLFAVEQNHVELAELLIRRDALITQQNEAGNSALHMAVQNFSLDMLELLLYYEIPVDMANNAGNTALHLAAKQGDQEICYKLLLHGAAIQATNHWNQTPLALAVSENQSSCALYLISNGAESQSLDENGRNLFQQACLAGNFEMADSLLAAGFEPNQALQSGYGLYDIVRLQHLKSLKNYLDSKGVQRFKGLHIDKIILSWDNSFHLNDYFMGGEIGINENYTNTAILFGINSRLFREAITTGENPVFQFWEKRLNVHLAMQYKIRLMMYEGESTGIYVQAKEMLSTASWEGTTQHPPAQFIFTPGAGIFLDGTYFFASAGIDYYTFVNHTTSPWHISLKLGAYFPDAL